MSELWITADHHFFHANIIEYCHRPFDSIEHMDQFLVDMWNMVVEPEDTVYHLGDFALGCGEKTRDVISRLNGDKYLLKGNHDRHSYQWYAEKGLKKLDLPNNILKTSNNNQYLLTHRPNLLSKIPVLCGHVHDNWIYQHPEKGSLHINVGVDAWLWKPVHIETLDKLKSSLSVILE